MFGYIRIHRSELKIREYETYRGCYCGLCRTLKKQYGRKGQLLLNYDCTFLKMLLDSLYEPDNTQKNCRCLAHPIVKHNEIISDTDIYAADMTVLLYYQKAMDDWNDNKKVGKRILAGGLAGAYRKAKARRPRQAEVLEEALKELTAAERANLQDIDYVSGLNGRFLAEMFAMKEDFWQEDLRELGFYLGKFIYLLDAWEDLEKDRKTGNYNPLIHLKEQEPEMYEESVRQILTEFMERAARAFERLPIVKNVQILRNILYAGVWERYYAVLKERNHPPKNKAEVTDTEENG